MIVLDFAVVKPAEPLPPLTKPETLRPYQKEASEYLLRHKRVLLADDMGTVFWNGFSISNDGIFYKPYYSFAIAFFEKKFDFLPAKFFW